MPATAYQPARPTYQQSYEPPRAQSFGIIPDLSRRIPNAAALLDKKALAKSRARNQTAECPACGKQYIKHHSGQIFCRVQCKYDFNDKLAIAKRNS